MWALLAVIVGWVWAQDWSKRKAELARLGSKIRITQAEFEYAYAKAHGGWEKARTHTPQQYRAYLEAYLNFRRKVADALARRLDTLQSFRREYEGYLRQLARPFLMEREVLDTLLRKVHARLREELRAAHILFTISEGDTAKAYQKALAVRDSIVRGLLSFEAAVRRHSEDPAASHTQGDLGYFSALDMVPEFEEAAYTTPVGDISLPVRTSYGYHLIQVRAREPHAGQRKVAHILVRWGPAYAAKDSVAAEARIREVYRRLQQGAKWEELARDFSDDPFSATQGGELGTARLIPQMEEIKRRLPVGGFSEPFRTRFGWHILKVLEVQPIGEYEVMRPTLKARLQRDPRYKAAEEAYFAKRLLAYKYQENSATRTALKQALDTLYPNLEAAQESLPTALLQATLFTLKGTRYSVKDFLRFWISQRTGERQFSEALLQSMLRRFAQEKVLDLELQELPARYPEFELLRQEYFNGVLFFNISEQEVWRKAVEDTAGLQRFYEAHRTEFPAGERLEVIEIIGTDSASLAELSRRLPEASLGLIDSVNRQGSFRWTILPRYIERAQADNLYQPYFADGSLSRWLPVRGSGREWKTAYVLRKLPAGYKTFEEVRIELIQKYQDFLEKAWLERLQKAYPARINEKVFARLFR
ncbi:MAG: peptidyl-prolyl cis-trans isomerase [Bacteroidia bacterium]|nr:peptidyl-prolyl cis-trans isomerase [Bacteroidia bacterium]MDW8089360.1 peptidylprolyl isomerase [Bacteroidia bacterium]